jgi:hypothetical protein
MTLKASCVPLILAPMGLVPGIHAVQPNVGLSLEAVSVQHKSVAALARVGVDGRGKPGHDGKRRATQRGLAVTIAVAEANRACRFRL